MGSFNSLELGPQRIDKLVVISETEAVTFVVTDITMTVNDKVDSLLNPFATYWQKGKDGVWRIAYEINALGPVKAPMPK